MGQMSEIHRQLQTGETDPRPEVEALKAEHICLEELARAKEMDTESDHYEADLALIKFLRATGFDRIADVWEEVGPKYWA